MRTRRGYTASENCSMVMNRTVFTKAREPTASGVNSYLFGESRGFKNILEQEDSIYNARWCGLALRELRDDCLEFRTELAGQHSDQKLANVMKRERIAIRNQRNKFAGGGQRQHKSFRRCI